MGFKMRSGNGPLPFKNMGSSPATFEGEVDMASTQSNTKASSDAEWKAKKSEYKTQKSDFKSTRKDFRKGNKEEISELKESGASRKDIRAAKKVNRQEQRDLKGAHKDDNKVAKKNWKSDEGYKAHKKNVRQQIGEGLDKFGTALGQSNYAGGTGSIASNIAANEQQDKTNEKQALHNELNEQKINTWKEENGSNPTSKTTPTDQFTSKDDVKMTKDDWATHAENTKKHSAELDAKYGYLDNETGLWVHPKKKEE